MEPIPYINSCNIQLAAEIAGRAVLSQQKAMDTARGGTVLRIQDILTGAITIPPRKPYTQSSDRATRALGIRSKFSLPRKLYTVATGIAFHVRNREILFRTVTT
jgi:hypothetical protein